MGCRAIAAEWGYFAYFQEEITGSVGVPVFLSSLLQVLLAQRIIGAGRVVGVLVALKKQLTKKHLSVVGIQPGASYVVAGAEDDGRCPEFDHLWVEALQTDPPTATTTGTCDQPANGCEGRPFTPGLTLNTPPAWG